MSNFKRNYYNITIEQKAEDSFTVCDATKNGTYKGTVGLAVHATTLAGALRALANKFSQLAAQPAGGADHAVDSSLESQQTPLEPVASGTNSPVAAQPANMRQIGGTHYKGTGIEHWDWCLAQPWGWGYMVGQITKYASRYKYKNGLQDLQKAKHFIDKLIEWETAQEAKSIK